MNARLLNIERGQTRCDHCNRHIKIICNIEQDQKKMKIGSTCVAKFIPELTRNTSRAVNAFKKAEKDAKRQLAYEESCKVKALEFQARIKGNPNLDSGSFYLKITDQEMAEMAPYLIAEGLESTDDKMIFKAENREQVVYLLNNFEGLVEIKNDEFSFGPTIKFLETYNGNNNFLCSLKSQYELKGFLSDNQLHAVNKFIDNIKEAPAPILLNDCVITLNRYFAQEVVMRHTGLERAHYNFEVFKIIRETDKAYFFEMRGTGKKTTCCCMCGILLRNEESIRLGIGPICRQKHGFDSASSADKATKERAVIFEAWIPKTCIKGSVNLNDSKGA